jgi:hypothetical protein
VLEKLFARRSAIPKMDKSESADAALWSTMVPLSVVKALLADALLPLKAVPALLERLVSIEERKVSLLEGQGAKLKTQSAPVRGPPKSGRDRQLQAPAQIQKVGANQEDERRAKWTPEELKAKKDYENIVNQRRSPAINTKCKILYKTGDIVSAPENVIIHLVGGNLRNSAGAARALSEEFGKPSQPATPFGIGEIVIQSIPGSPREIWHTVSKGKSRDKKYENPGAFYSNFVSALVAIKDKISERGLRRVALTKLGSGLDNINWKFTRQKLKEIFIDIEVELVFYSLAKPDSFPGGGVGAAQGAHKPNREGRYPGVAQGSVGGGCPLQPPTTSRPPDKPSTVRYELQAQQISVSNAPLSSLEKPMTAQFEPRTTEIQREECRILSTRLSGGGDNSQSPPPSLKPPRTKPNTKVMSEFSSVNMFSPLAPELSLNANDVMRHDGLRQEGLMDDFALTARLSGGGGQSMPPLPSKEPPQTNNPFEVVSSVVSEPIVSNPSSISDPGFMTRFFDEMGKMRESFDAMTEKISPVPAPSSLAARKTTPVPSKVRSPLTNNVTLRRSKNLSNLNKQVVK